MIDVGLQWRTQRHFTGFQADNKYLHRFGQWQMRVQILLEITGGHASIPNQTGTQRRQHGVLPTAFSALKLLTVIVHR
jgi:hypothetical protein